MNDEQIKALREAALATLGGMPVPTGTCIAGAHAALAIIDRLASAESRAERAEAEVARLTTAMPDDGEIYAIRSIYDDPRHPVFVTEYIGEWLSRLPAPVATKEPEGFCACGRRTSECDRSRKACASREVE